MQLWLMNDDEDFLMAMVTEIKMYDKVKSCHILCIGGEDLYRTLGFLDYLELWARRQNCSEIVVTGRKGWKPVLRKYGYQEKTVTVIKDISHIREH